MNRYKDFNNHELKFMWDAFRNVHTLERDKIINADIKIRHNESEGKPDENHWPLAEKLAAQIRAQRLGALMDEIAAILKPESVS